MLQDAFGTNGTEFAIAQLNKLISVSRNADGKVEHVSLNGLLAMIEGQFDSASNAAVKLLRTFVMQAEVLAKLQRGGEQIVKIVHVHSGAQAIVGNVVQHPPPDGGGVIDDNANQPHAKAELPAGWSQPMPEVLSTDSQRHPMPLAIGQR